MRCGEECSALTLECTHTVLTKWTKTTGTQGLHKGHHEDAPEIVGNLGDIVRAISMVSLLIGF